MRPTKHGLIIVHVCHGCFARWATYEGSCPRGWVRIGKHAYCRWCQRKKH